VAITHRFQDRLPRARTQRHLNRLSTLRSEVILDGIRVGGGLLAASELESMLIAAFADRSISAIYLDGVTADSAADDLTALIDAEGQPTGVGLVVDRLFRQRWWTDAQLPADELGNARLRVFAGRYAIEAELPDGRVFETEVRVPHSPETRVVVLEPVWERQKPPARAAEVRATP
jgi:hypothetical protein